MDKKEWSALLRLVAQLIEISEPQRAEYLRGYHRGIRAHVLGVPDNRTEERQHIMLMARSGSDSGAPYVDLYARGYRHGLLGKKPESSSVYSSPLPIAYNSKQYFSYSPRERIK